MKKLLSILALSVLTMFAVSAQETINVDITKLSSEQLRLYQQLKQQQAQAQAISVDSLTPEKIDKYAAIGKSFGTAFKECWSTVSTDAERFAQSPAGKWAMVLVSWKIMGNDAVNLLHTTVRFCVGVCLLSIGVPFFMYIIRRNCMETPQLVSKTKIWIFTVKKEYKGINSPIHADSIIAYFGGFVLLVIICCMIMFM